MDSSTYQSTNRWGPVVTRTWLWRGYQVRLVRNRWLVINTKTDRLVWDDEVNPRRCVASDVFRLIDYWLDFLHHPQP